MERVVLTSRGRGWRGCDAVLYDAAGPTELLCSPTSLRTSVRHAQTIVVHLAPSIVEQVASDMGLDPRRTLLAPQLHLRDRQIELLADAFVEELETVTSPSACVEGLSIALAAQILRHYTPLTGRVSEGMAKRRLHRVVEYIREHIGCELTIDELAAVANVSASHFKVLFKQSMGMPAHQYVIQARVDHAVGLIRCTPESIAVIAAQSGFASQSHMSRCMRRLRGVTPAELRRA